MMVRGCNKSAMISSAFVCYTDNAVLFIVAIFDNSACT